MEESRRRRRNQEGEGGIKNEKEESRRRRRDQEGERGIKKEGSRRRNQEGEGGIKKNEGSRIFIPKNKYYALNMIYFYPFLYFNSDIFLSSYYAL